MKEFNNKIAIVTGAASGIGRAIVERYTQEGMKVVLADIEEKALSQTEQELRATSANVLSVRTDVSRAEDVNALAEKALNTFGAVHLLFNNAGVGAGSTAWDTSNNDWTWTLSVNLWGVIHGIQAFLPIMLAQEEESYLFNTSSIAGLLPFHAVAPYQVSKHAVVALSEKLYYDLGENENKIKVSVLCPGWVQTRILDSERNRPPEYFNTSDEMNITPEMESTMQLFQQAVENGMPPAEVADQVF
ncbi:MAG TPA: SDR family NAD(P)-dependent oxidoreductase [Anaerolineales bacterium]|nr:SDR family NAD(P)-dependent oxidoreductase [Anaerolineales bacterium]